jgi:hypothetical protein
MTALDLINKFNKDVWNHSDKMFGDTFDSIFDSWSKATIVSILQCSKIWKR